MKEAYLLRVGKKNFHFSKVRLGTMLKKIDQTNASVKTRLGEQYSSFLDPTL
jgi:hypothetical protein